MRTITENKNKKEHDDKKNNQWREHGSEKTRRTRIIGKQNRRMYFDHQCHRFQCYWICSLMIHLPHIAQPLKKHREAPPPPLCHCLPFTYKELDTRCYSTYSMTVQQGIYITQRRYNLHPSTFHVCWCRSYVYYMLLNYYINMSLQYWVMVLLYHISIYWYSIFLHYQFFYHMIIISQYCIIISLSDHIMMILYYY